MKVKIVFESMIKDGMEEHAQVCAIVDGKVVVNLVGIAHEERENHHQSYLPYASDSIQNIFSSTKAITSIVVAMLVDRGYLRYDMPISDIWPGDPHLPSLLDQISEFAQLDKHVITLEELLRHESGMDKFTFSIDGRYSFSSLPPHSSLSQSTPQRVDQSWGHRENDRRFVIPAPWSGLR
jgi:CubicO group peptidase (beta-lactamase class C family)